MDSLKNILRVLIIVCLLSNCKYNIHTINADKEYQEKLKLFENKYIDHFPKKIENLPISYTIDTTNEYDHPRFILNYKVSKQQIDTMIPYFEDRAIKVYSPADTNLLITNRFTNNSNWSSKNKALKSKIAQFTEKINYTGKYPIPNFWDNPLSVDITECKLPKDFKLYVIDAKSGRFFKEQFYTSGLYMPKEWKNGYSKGVAISKERNIIIYWLIIW